jgi:hypothetical protein
MIFGSAKMNQTTLEQLMMDEAMTALSPDVSELLAAYLGTVPQGDAQLKCWRETADVARHALVATLPVEMPAFPGGQFRRASRFRLTGAVSAMAAILVGIGIGRYWERPSSSHIQYAQIIETAPAPVSVSDFWSSERLMASIDSGRQPRRSAWQWTSPARQPFTGLN